MKWIEPKWFAIWAANQALTDWRGHGLYTRVFGQNWMYVKSDLQWRSCENYQQPMLWSPSNLYTQLDAQLCCISVVVHLLNADVASMLVFVCVCVWCPAKIQYISLDQLFCSVKREANFHSFTLSPSSVSHSSHSGHTYSHTHSSFHDSTCNFISIDSLMLRANSNTICVIELDCSWPRPDKSTQTLSI